jgi:hypothetical protein
MAVLYMLNIESSLSLSNKSVDTNRREILKRFHKWVPCQCSRGCNRSWNFVNGVGLWRGGDEGKKCDFPGLMEKSEHWSVAFKGDQARRLEATRGMWLARM